MIQVLEGRLVVSGAMNHDTAKVLLDAGVAQLRSGEHCFDLSAVSDVDSSGLAVLFAWMRAATQRGCSVRVTGLPANLLSLADLYGVADLLPRA